MECRKEEGGLVRHSRGRNGVSHVSVTASERRGKSTEIRLEPTPGKRQARDLYDGLLESEIACKGRVGVRVEPLPLPLPMNY